MHTGEALTSIELKKTRSNHDPLMQLAIWNSALFQRLKWLLGLTRKGDKLLLIPSVTVSGHTWQVCYSYIEKDGYSRVSCSIALGFLSED